MTLTREINLPAKANARPKRGRKGSWIELAPDLWLSEMPDVQAMVPAGPSGGQIALSYDFAAARLSPPSVAKLFPKQTTRILARVRAVLDEKLATLLVEPAGRERLEPAGFPSLNWPHGTSIDLLSKQREMHRDRSLALRRFLSAARAWNEVSAEDVANNITLRIKALNLPVPAKLALHLDGEGGKARLRLVLEDAGLAIPGSGRIVLVELGYKFEPYPDALHAGLCFAYAQSLAEYLARSAYIALNGIPLSGQVEARVGNEAAFVELSRYGRVGPVF
jgi:hypothetical protein